MQISDYFILFYGQLLLIHSCCKWLFLCMNTCYLLAIVAEEKHSSILEWAYWRRFMNDAGVNLWWSLDCWGDGYLLLFYSSSDSNVSVVFDPFYMTLFSALEKTLCDFVTCDSEWVTVIACFLNNTLFWKWRICLFSSHSAVTPVICSRRTTRQQWHKNRTSRHRGYFSC